MNGASNQNGDSTEPISFLDFIVILTIFGFLAVAIAVYCGYLSQERVTAVAPILLAGITLAYAYLTYKLVQETRRGRQERVKPALHLETDRYSPKIVNRGRGPAIDVSAEFTVDDGDSPMTIDVGSLEKDTEYLINKQPYSGVVDPDDEIHDRFQTLSVEMSWKDLLGNHNSTSITVETEELISHRQPDAAHLRELNSTLTDIHTELRQLRNCLNSNPMGQSNDEESE